MERRDRCGNKGSRLVVKKAKRDRERQAKQQRAVGGTDEKRLWGTEKGRCLSGVEKEEVAETVTRQV